MGLGQIEVNLLQMHLPFKSNDCLGEDHGFSSKAAISVSKIQSLPFDIHLLDIMQKNTLEQFSSEKPYYIPSCVLFFGHLSKVKRRIGHYFCPSRSSSHSRSAIIGFKPYNDSKKKEQQYVEGP